MAIEENRDFNFSIGNSGQDENELSQPNQILSDVQICVICREKNLTDQTQFNNCVKCQRVYCLHYSSTIDPQYCTGCLHDVQVKEEIVSKTETHYNEETDKLYTRTRKAKRISLGGMHWLFAARKIRNLDDLELDLAIEYHKDVLSQMLYERDERRSQKAHRYAGKQIKFESTVKSESTVEVKKTKVKQATKADPMAALAEALKTLQKSGLSVDDIAKMAIGGMKK